MSKRVRAGLPEQLSTGNHADVCIRFHLERSPDQQRQQQEQQQTGGEVTEKGHVAANSLVGDPLLSHKVILTIGSTYFKAKLEKSCWQGLRAGGLAAVSGTAAGNEGQRGKRRKTEGAPLQRHPGEPEEESQGAAVSALPEVLVPLASEDEVPFARQAIEFIYKGSLGSDLDFEALLRVRQQACYLGVEDCPQTCDEAMLAWLQADQQQQHANAAEGGTAAARSRVLVAYSCHALFPKPGTDDEPTSFDAVRAALAKQLVSYFGDAVAALTRPDLYQQLLQLPAVAVRELLAADDFGTDSEDSVFLLLACWLDAMEEQEGVSGKTRAELWRLVRLHRLGRPYLHFVLPVYKPHVISRLDLGFLTQYAGAGEGERERLLDVDSGRRGFPWYCSAARRQVVPEGGRTLEWSISREQLEQGLRELLATKTGATVEATFGGSASALDDWDTQGTRVISRGLLWGVNVVLSPEILQPEGPGAAAGHGAAGLYLVLDAPEQLGEVSGVAAAYAELNVHRWAQGQREVAFSTDFTMDDLVQTEKLWGVHNALDLPPTAAAAAAVGSGKGSPTPGVDAEVAVQLARWSEWMHEGKITGTLTFLRQ